MKSSNRRDLSPFKGAIFLLLAAVLLLPIVGDGQSTRSPLRIEEATVQSIHAAFRSGKLTSHQLVQMYLDRIEIYDKNGPKINSFITVNSKALEDADRLDAAFKKSGFVGPLHGIPVVIKD